jgi:3-deoxy-manno-octulosonate cytidylyltransferase (CMP-KDO synthetase)
MLEWVYRRAMQVKRFDSVIIATDNKKIYDYMHAIGAEITMTPEDLSSGTDRVAYVAQSLDAEVIVNVQGDEPLILPAVLDKLCVPFSEKDVMMATPITKIKSVDDLTNPNLARVIIDKKQNAIYFTRATIPFIRDSENRQNWIEHHQYFKQIGIYAYRREFLLHLTKLPQGNLEKAEKLEQLRVLENGYKIRTVYTDYHSLCVDTEEDLININDYVRQNKLTAEDRNGKL